MSVNVPSSQWRLATNGGIKYKRVNASGEFSEEGASAQEQYIIKANQLIPFVLESFPPVLESLGGLLYPLRGSMPGLAVLQVKKIAWKGLTDGKPTDPFNSDPTAESGTYEDNLMLTVDYGTSPYNAPANDDPTAPDPNDPLTFLEISANASGSHIAMPTRAASTWLLDPEGDPTDPAEPRTAVKELNIPNSFIEPVVEWNVRWTQIPFSFMNGTLIGRLRSAIGKVNSEEMSLLHSAPAETILFLGYHYTQQFTWRSGFAGQPPVTLEMRFLEKNFIDRAGVQVHHNLLYRPGVGYRRLMVDNQFSIHAETDLDSIFLPNPP